MAHNPSRKVRRRYVANIVANTGTAVIDLYNLSQAVSRCFIRRLRIAQTSESPVDEETLAISIIRGFTSAGSGSTSRSWLKLNSGDPDYGNGSVLTMVTTVASGGTPTNVFEDAWNVKEPYDMFFAPDEAIYVPISSEGHTVIRLGAPADAISLKSTIWIEQAER